MPNTPANIFSLNREFNPNATYTVGNLVAFADAAGTAPTDGTGGAPTVTITRTTSSPLEGIASFLFTKDAANRQGEGFSTDIALQASDATKVFTLSYDYQISTGTYTGYQAPPLFSDLTVWVYDVTNSVMYQTTPYQIDGTSSSTNQYNFQAQWQVPTGCLTARVIWFLGNTGTSAFTAKFNNITFGRIPRVSATVVTPASSFTPTFGAMGTVSLQSLNAYRVGSYAVAQGDFITGTAGGSLATMSLPFNAIPDPNIYGISFNYAIGTWYEGSSSTLFGPIILAGSSPGILYFNRSSLNPANSLQAANGNAIFNNNKTISLNISYAVSGWGAAGTIGQDADTRVVAAKYAMGNTYTFGGGADRAMEFDTLYFDTHMAATYGSGVTFGYIAPIAGIYRCAVAYQLASSGFSAGNSISVAGMINGTSFVGNAFQTQRVDGTAIRPINSNSSLLFQAKSGDLFTILASINGLTAGIQGNLLSRNYIEIQRISGPAQIQASDNPNASYNTTAGQSIANATTAIVNFDTQIWDTFGLVTTGASWKFTCNRQGKIKVNSMVTFASAVFTQNNVVKLYLYKNGVFYKSLSQSTIETTVTDPITVSGEATVQVNAGDTLDVRVSHGESASRSLTATATENYIDVAYLSGG